MKTTYYTRFALLLGVSLLSSTSPPPLPVHTYVHVIKKENFTPETEVLLQRALVLVDSVINTPVFREGVLAAHFVSNKNLSNEQILSLLLHGHEVHKPVDNDTMDFVLETYPDQNGDNIGTTHGSKRIVTSQAYIRRNGARCYAAHLIHEYCHTIGLQETGFGHLHRVGLSKKRRRLKCQSVPYIVGDLARKILAVETCHCECEDYVQT